MEYSTIDNIKNSLKAAWKHKILWIFALTLVVGSSRYSITSFDQLSNKPEEENTEIPEENPIYNTYLNINKFSKHKDSNKNVLGDSDLMIPLENDEEYTFESILQEYIEDQYTQDDIATELAVTAIMQYLASYNFVPHLIILVVSFLLWFLTVVTVSFLVKTWIKGGYYSGTLMIAKNGGQEPLNLKNLGEKGNKHFGQLVRLYIKIALEFLLILIFISLFTALVPIISIDNNLINALIIFGSVFSLFYFIYKYVSATIFGSREIIEKNITYKQAFKNATNMALKNPKHFVKLVIGNIIVMVSIGIFALIALGTVSIGLVLLGIGLYKTDNIGLFAMVIASASTIFALSIILISQALAGFINTYKEFTYSYLYTYLANNGLSNESKNKGGFGKFSNKLNKAKSE